MPRLETPRAPAGKNLHPQRCHSLLRLERAYHRAELARRRACCQMSAEETSGISNSPAAKALSSLAETVAESLVPSAFSTTQSSQQAAPTGSHKLLLRIQKAHARASVGLQLASTPGDTIVRVSKVTEGGEAAKAGASVGDVVHSINGVACTSPHIGADVFKTATPGHVQLLATTMKPIEKMSIKQLKAALDARSVSYADCNEKHELLRRLQNIDQLCDAAASRASPRPPTSSPPPTSANESATAAAKTAPSSSLDAAASPVASRKAPVASAQNGQPCPGSISKEQADGNAPAEANQDKGVPGLLELKESTSSGGSAWAFAEPGSIPAAPSAASKLPSQSSNGRAGGSGLSSRTPANGSAPAFVLGTEQGVNNVVLEPHDTLQDAKTSASDTWYSWVLFEVTKNTTGRKALREVEWGGIGFGHDAIRRLAPDRLYTVMSSSEAHPAPTTPQSTQKKPVQVDNVYGGDANGLDDSYEPFELPSCSEPRRPSKGSSSDTNFTKMASSIRTAAEEAQKAVEKKVQKAASATKVAVDKAAVAVEDAVADFVQASAAFELESKLAEACSNDPWGASDAVLSELAKATFNHNDFSAIMKYAWEKMVFADSECDSICNTLDLIEFLVRNGSSNVVVNAREHLGEIEQLQMVTLFDAEGRDIGINIRERAKQIVELLTNDELLNEERDKARAPELVSSELDEKLAKAMGDQPSLPSPQLIYEIGSATKIDDNYPIIMAAIWQRLGCGLRPTLKTLMVLESVLNHGSDRAIEEIVGKKTDIEALKTMFGSTGSEEAIRVQEKATAILAMLNESYSTIELDRGAGDLLAELDAMRSDTEDEFASRGERTKNTAKVPAPHAK